MNSTQRTKTLPTVLFFAFLASGIIAAASLVYIPALPVALVATCYGIVGLWTLGLAFIVVLLVCPPLTEKLMTTKVFAAISR